jgi:arylsulfatase A-like enzyme
MAPHINVLFVFADQLRASAVGCYGDEAVATPRIDAFATQGMRFPVAVSSTPLCGPYRASLLTGLHPLSNGVIVNDIPLGDEHVTLGECFASAGYDTAYIGKWHLDGPDRLSPVPPGSRRRGFRHWAASNFEHNYVASKFFRGDDPTRHVWPGYDAQAQTDELIGYLDERRGAREPFFAVLSWGPPHNPYRMVPQRHLEQYDKDAIQRRPNATEFPVDDLWGYYAQTSFLDEQFGRLLDALKQNGQAENTLVVFTSDHGDMHGSQGVYKKGWPWDESIRVPLIMRLPGSVPPNSRARFPISTVDLMPTLLGLCGLPAVRSVEGIDCSAGIRDSHRQMQWSVLISNPCPATVLDARGEDMVPQFRGRNMEFRGVRTSGHTYVETREGPWLLYDNIADRYQTRNLIGDGASASLMEELRAETWQHLKRLGDDFAPRETYYRRFGVEVDNKGLLKGVVKNPYPATN